MNGDHAKPGLSVLQLLNARWSILTGSALMLSIEVTRECPLSCPGCYAYGDAHLGGSVTLRSLSDYYGDELVNGIIRLVEQHRPLHVTLVGGEPGSASRTNSGSAYVEQKKNSHHGGHQRCNSHSPAMDANPSGSRIGIGGRSSRTPRCSPQAGDI